MWIWHGGGGTISLAASTGRVTLLDADLGSPEVFAASDGPARIGAVA